MRQALGLCGPGPLGRRRRLPSSAPALPHGPGARTETMSRRRKGTRELTLLDGALPVLGPRLGRRLVAAARVRVGGRVLLLARAVVVLAVVAVVRRRMGVIA